MPREVAGFDSATGMVVALARFLHGLGTPPLGDPLIHLCAALGVPWLPQTVLIPVRQRGLNPDEPRRAADAFDRTARALLDGNPDLVLHHMHDPVQDRLTLRRIACFRVKRTRLGRAYEEFLTDVLEPGGTVLLAECRQTWPVSSRGERHVFQFGAVGGLPPHESTAAHASATICAATGFRPGGGRRRPWTARRRAEWGFEPGLRDDVRRFAKERGYRVARLVHDEPEDLSTLVADLYRRWYRRRGRPTNRLLIESFMLLDPWWTLRTGSVPYWTLFPVRPSLDRLHRYLDGADTYDFMHLGLFCHGVGSPGSVSAAEWRDLLGRAGVKGAFAGVSPRRYPADPGTFFEFPRALRTIPQRHPLPEPLTLSEVEAYVGGQYFH
ncbi:hypothetical protein GCM10010109_52060 [Actinoplanes campanulatus]|nr:hypothetical protein GCM10010109_52060 [Actinoplanes campanulatus]GID41356.1 hypothetical protein Aca09nite_78620 [Actinoplanes campanulatus]